LLDFNFLPAMHEGPLRSGIIVAVSALVVTVIVLALHRMGVLLLCRIARHQTNTALSKATELAFRASQATVWLLGMRLVLTGAPDDTPWLLGLSHIASTGLILAITWLIVRCIDSVSNALTQVHRVDVLDNMKARQVLTQTRVLARSAKFIVGVLGLSFVLLALPGARQIGASLLASAGVAGLVAGMAARPVLGNFIAGLQIAFSQPIRIDDVLIVKGEWGRVEEITGTFVVVRIWDERRMIVPLQWFIENPFENWTHTSSTILGTVFLWVDFSVPVPAIRAEFERLCHANNRWDQRVCVLQVTDTSERALQLRLLVSAVDSGVAFELRCDIREGIVAYIAEHYPHCLPRLRSTIDPLEVHAGKHGSGDAVNPMVDMVKAAKQA
jgi:small-conductance mechanosensitive channel